MLLVIKLSIIEALTRLILFCLSINNIFDNNIKIIIFITIFNILQKTLINFYLFIMLINIFNKFNI